MTGWGTKRSSAKIKKKTKCRKICNVWWGQLLGSEVGVCREIVRIQKFVLLLFDLFVSLCFYVFFSLLPPPFLLLSTYLFFNYYYWCLFVCQAALRWWTNACLPEVIYVVCCFVVFVCFCFFLFIWFVFFVWNIICNIYFVVVCRHCGSDRWYTCIEEMGWPSVLRWRDGSYNNIFCAVRQWWR